MNIRQLKYFVQIVESGSLSKASRELRIAQPALSQQMISLEEEVGRKLLLRSSRGVTMTTNGEALYRHAKFMLRQLEQAIDIARRGHTDVSGRVQLGMAPTTTCALAVPLLRQIKAKYPAILLDVVEGYSGHLENMTRDGELDLSILFSSTSVEDLSIEPLLTEEFYLVMSQDSRLLPPECHSLSLQEVAQLPLILPRPAHGSRRRFEVEFERANLTLHTVGEIDSLHLLMQCVADGTGATIQPMAATFAVSDENMQWRCLPISGVNTMRHNYLCALPSSKLSPIGDIVRCEIRLLVGDLIQSGRWQGTRLPTA